MSSTSNNLILLVEDNPDDSFLIQRAITRAELGASLQVTESGREAMHYLTGNHSYADRNRYPLPIVILSDLNLGDMSGTELLEWVKQQPKLQLIPMLIMSSSEPDSTQINRTKELGAVSFLVKSTGFEDLVDILKTLIS